MTPAERAVLNDVLCSVTSNGVPLDAATRERMAAVVDPNYIRDTCLRVGMAVRMRAQAVVRVSPMREDAADEIDRIDVAEQTDLRLPRAASFSPAETPSAASPHCRDTEKRIDCRACGGSGLANLDDVRPDEP